jgi:hypothetical protein
MTEPADVKHAPKVPAKDAAADTPEKRKQEYEKHLVQKNEEDGRAAAYNVEPTAPSTFASTPVQSTYPNALRPGIAGAIVNEEPVLLISRTVEEAAGIAFGIGVIQGVADKGCKLGAYAAGKWLGVTVRERSIKAEFPNGFMQYDSARIMAKGVIWVATTAAVVAGDPVVMSATGNLTKGTGTGDIPNARWDSSQATPGGLAQLRLF